MKKTDIPQDPSSLSNFTKEICYAIDEKGNYSTNLSTGWDVKASALNVAWEDIEKRIAQAKAKVLNGEASPILFYMELKLMDFTILSSYTGFYIWTIKRHLKPKIFNKLSEKNLKLYAETFDINIDKLKTAKYTLQPRDHQKLWYVVPTCQETIITASASDIDYERVSFLLKKGEIYLTLKKKDYLKLLEMFDIFLVDDVVLLMIPITATVNGIIIRQYHLALMSGKGLDKALYLASQQRYDILTGWCCGDVTEADVIQEKGLITVVTAYLECYNASKMIAPADWFLPFF